ncbi:MAG TPA: Ni/Fe-hydrogenase cytochrome b subunit [Vicinamibacteria bacterium]|nr:Ni/Fe-hydrogenase cytochrome b subunit [Vicinamibacteria bacterium]
MSTHATVVPGPIDTRPFRLLAGVAALGLVFVALRFALGIGAVSGLSDGYPWGIWIAWDVVTGTALACGGYALAILVYVLNNGRYHPLVRPAVLTSALGYSMAGFSIFFDVGRPWALFKVPLQFWNWNVNSALLEVALCITAYVVIVWIEMTPAILERAKDEPTWPTLRRLARRLSGPLEKALPFILALGLLLPTMHQSSLGSLMLLSGHKLHRLWHTPLLPLLFLVSCVAMGYAAVVFEAALSSWAFKRKRETTMLSALARPTVITIALYLALRLGDLVYRGRIGMALQPSLYALMFALEVLLFVVGAFMLTRAASGGSLGALFRAAVVIMAAGALYRFDTYLVAFDPGPNWSYFPAVPELFMTLGVIALEIVIYLAFVKTFPVIGGETAAEAR